MLADESEAKPPVIVLAIDQAEELFLGDGVQEGQALLELIRDLVSERSSEGHRAVHDQIGFLQPAGDCEGA
jgi:hypothetical protein